MAPNIHATKLGQTGLEMLGCLALVGCKVDGNMNFYKLFLPRRKTSLGDPGQFCCSYI